MMKPVHLIRLFLLGFSLLLTACGGNALDVDVSEIKADLQVERFDIRLFGVPSSSPESAIGSIYSDYGDFFDIFNVYVINIGSASEKRYPSYLSMFINDPLNREVFEYTGKVFADMDGINTQLSDGFRHYLYHYPDSTLPRVVGYVSRFNQGLFTVDRFVGVGLDQYLGSDCPYYNQMASPQYLTRNKVPERVPVDVMMAWATQIYPYNDSVDNVLNRMIHKGMLAWFVDAMYPQMEEYFLMAFSEDQMKWCRNIEKQMWTYLVEEKLLFSTDQM
ncbi:MAG: hypothetical protein QNK35_17655, partial [Bacteroides sp.]|nr:hypothetical protein [Bacteroides sp.]